MQPIDICILLIVILLLGFAFIQAIRHLKGNGCCGSGHCHCKKHPKQ
ncbi:hypothetical protein [Merdibacter massiliensis]|nr:hypothetical protein [Merdibacter massiliensis]